MKKFIIFMFCLVVLPVYAAEWKQIDGNVYIDVSSIKPYNTSSYERTQYNRDEKEFWMKKLNDNSSYFKDYEKRYNEKVSHEITKFIVDCNNKTIAIKAFVIYGIKGKVIYSYDEKDILLERRDIIPESTGEYFYNLICGY